MTKEGIIEYLRIVKDVETDIYLTKSLKEKIKSESANNQPVVPNKPRYPGSIEARNMSNELVPKKTRKQLVGKYIIILFIIDALFAIFLIALQDSVAFECILIVGMVVVMCSILGCFSIQLFNAKKKIVEKINSQNLAKYNSELNNYQTALKEYNDSVSLIKNRNIKIFSELDHAIEVLNNLLTKLYDIGVIYPKYHDWVAICSFIEYFESGRCESLDGPKGAYNIFESEKRQNLIISELSKIQDKMETIKANQYELYNAITSANSFISNSFSAIIQRQDLTILENRINTQKIVASNYFAHIR